MENSPEKQEKGLTPGVAIDGATIRAIREEKKLTQLYVANVVGVTTDTISRWENNRYPTIKRENAEKLAFALEVDLESLLKNDDSPAPVADSPPAAGRSKGMRLVMLLLGIAMATALTAYFFRQPAQHPTAARILPHFGAPGETVPVQIRITRKGEENTGFIIKEHLPEGWRLVTSSLPAASGTISPQEVKWLVPAGTSPVTILYTARISPTATLESSAALKGSIVSRADGSSRTDTIDGDQFIRIAGVHWADTNGDGRIDDDEIMPAYYITEEMKGLGLDWKTIEAIWSAGAYRWDRQKQVFLIVK
jgi:transcriptional regulator with XRE-family HTH domain